MKVSSLSRHHALSLVPIATGPCSSFRYDEISGCGQSEVVMVTVGGWDRI